MATSLWLQSVKYRTRAEAYGRIEALDMNRLRNHMIDLYDEGYVARLSDDEIRGEVRNMADYIYPDSLSDVIDGTTIMELDGKKYIFAGGLTTEVMTPSEEFDMMVLLLSMGIDED